MLRASGIPRKIRQRRAIPRARTVAYTEIVGDVIVLLTHERPAKTATCSAGLKAAPARAFSQHITDRPLFTNGARLRCSER